MTTVNTREPPTKKQKQSHVPANGFTLYKSGDDIRKALSSQSPEELKNSLLNLRNQLTIRTSETTISPNDERLLLAKQWLDSSSGAHDLFGIWDYSSQQNGTTVSLALGVLAVLLPILNKHFIYQSLGDPIMQNLVSPTYMRRLNGYLGGAQADLILVTLKLLNEMVVFAGGREKRAVMDGFAWGLKSLPKLLFMRRRGQQNEPTTDSFAKADIRTLYITFLLSFVAPTTPTSLKIAILEDHKDVFTSLFKGMAQDPHDVVRHVLEVCWEGIWCDGKIRRTTKIGVFSESILLQLTKIYDRVEPEGSEADNIPADVVHHFLLAITTRPGTGLCFRDRGWYPPQKDDAPDDDGSRRSAIRVHNKALGYLLKSLKINEDARQQELALKILAACPELVSGYWSTAGISLEPRLSSRWITNVAFFGTIISLPVPTYCFSPPPTSQESSSTISYHPTPPLLHTILENVLPSAFSKVLISKGLQASTAPLVRHCTSLALTKCLEKFEAVREAFKIVEAALEEDESGQWASRRVELEKEIRKRVPDFQVIVALQQRVQPSAKAQSDGTDAIVIPETPGDITRNSLLTEAAQRLMWLYHRSLPTLVSEGRFDPGKLLLSLSDSTDGVGSSQQAPDSPIVEINQARGMDTLGHLHVLHLLQESDQFTWSSKLGAAGHSHLYHLLKLYIRTPVPAVRDAASSLTLGLLSRSVLFEHDPSEIEIWLNALPRTRRASGASAPDEAPLTDEGEGVLAFLDDCIQRCLKTPYRYLEEGLAAFVGGPSTSDTEALRPNAVPSPLFITVLEQFSAKASAKTITPSDTLAVATYMRKLAVGMLGKQSNLKYTPLIAKRVDNALRDPKSLEDYPALKTGVARERRLLTSTLGVFDIGVGAAGKSAPSNAAVEEFLTAIETSTPDQATAQSNATELVDWLRLIDQPLTSGDLARLARVIERWSIDGEAIREFFLQIEPGTADLSSIVPDLLNSDIPVSQSLTFECAFILSTKTELTNEAIRSRLASILMRDVSMSRTLRAVRIILHRFESQLNPGSHPSMDVCLGLLAKILLGVSELPEYDALPVKLLVFKDSSHMHDLFYSGGGPFPELDSVILYGLDAQEEIDRALVADCCKHWTLQIVATATAKSGHNPDQLFRALSWLPLMSDMDLLACFDALVPGVVGTHPSDNPPIIRVILEKVFGVFGARTKSSGLMLGLGQRTSGLLSLLPSFSSTDSVSTSPHHLLPLVITAHLPTGLDGQRTVGLSSNLGITCDFAGQRWKARSNTPQDGVDVMSILTQEHWTPASGQIVSALIYQSTETRVMFARWLATEGSNIVWCSEMARPILAFIDSAPSGSAKAPGIADTLVGFVPHLLSGLLPVLSQQDSTLYADCLVGIFSLASDRQSYYDALKTVMESSPTRDIFRNTFQTLVLRLAEADQEHTLQTLLDSFVDRGLKWIVRCFAEESPDSSRFLLSLVTFGRLMSFSSEVKAHLAEPVITAAIQNRLLSSDAMRFTSDLVSCTSLKPVNSNRLLQNILQHSHFSAAAGRSSPDSLRASVISLLHVLFNMHPINSCQPSHIAPLVKIYGGSLSRPDRQILSIFRLFEQHRQLSTFSALKQWTSSTASPPASRTLDALTSLDPTIISRTYSSFPKPLSTLNDGEEDPALYDPAFILPLLSGIVIEESELAGLDWVVLFRTNCVGMALCALASKDDHLRELASTILLGIWRRLQNASFQERDQTVYILNLARDMMSSPEPSTFRLPTYSVLLLAHALRAVYYPSNFMYPLLSRFLLQRPELDKGDVPMLFGLLYSSSDDWRKERGWMVRFLADGMKSTQDWKVLKRRHTWELLASLFQASDSDKPLRIGILDVLANLTKISQATTSLVLRSSLLPWIEIQVLEIRGGEEDRWLSILVNILRSLDHEKADHATLGAWRQSMHTCIGSIIKRQGPISRLQTVAQILVQLLAGGSSSLPASDIFVNMLSWLKTLESGINLDDEVIKAFDAVRHVGESTRPSELTEPLLAWGTSVELMWEVVMTSKNDSEATTLVWNELMTRLLVWNTFSHSRVGEWARRESLVVFGH